MRISAQTPDDSLLHQLNLTPEQKIVLKTLIWEHKEEEKKRNNELRRKMYRHLTTEQRAIVRQWWRKRHQQGVPPVKPVFKK
jgi:hypothetical protein